MNEIQSDGETTFQCLQNKYGPVMTLATVAETLDRSVAGLRSSLNAQTELAELINGKKKTMGRRVYFSTREIAAVIDEFFQSDS